MFGNSEQCRKCACFRSGAIRRNQPFSVFPAGAAHPATVAGRAPVPETVPLGKQTAKPSYMLGSQPNPKVSKTSHVEVYLSGTRKSTSAPSSVYKSNFLRFDAARTRAVKL